MSVGFLAEQRSFPSDVGCKLKKKEEEETHKIILKEVIPVLYGIPYFLSTVFDLSVPLPTGKVENAPYPS